MSFPRFPESGFPLYVGRGGVSGNFGGHWSSGCICSLATNDFRSFQAPRPYEEYNIYIKGDCSADCSQKK